jgi:hypothetical protein
VEFQFDVRITRIKMFQFRTFAYQTSFLVAFGLLSSSNAAAQVSELTADGSNSTSGTFSTGFPTLASTGVLSGAGNTYNYLAVPWIAGATQTYTFGQTSSSVDTILILYEGVYDPTSPGANALDLNDDTAEATHRTALGDPSRTIMCSTPMYCPQLTRSLTAGTRYTLVISTFSAGASLGSSQVFYAIGPGAFSTSLAAPEPPRVSATTTHAEVFISANAVRGQIARREAAITSVLNYDSNVFGRHNWSISFIGRYTATSGANADGAGALVAAYRLAPSVRIGAFIDYAVRRTTPTGIDDHDEQPTFGGFAVYQASPDMTGFNARVSGAYNRAGMTITRSDLLPGTEGGSGQADVDSFGLGGEVGYGVALAEGLAAVPFLGVRYTDVTRGSYGEEASADVTSPLFFRDYTQRLTTGITGLRVFGSFGTRFGFSLAVGAEYDLARTMGPYAGTSSISGLETFSVAMAASGNRARAFASGGLSYLVAPNQKLSAEVAVRQQPYAAEPSVTALLKYAVGF